MKSIYRNPGGSIFPETDKLADLRCPMCQCTTGFAVVDGEIQCGDCQTTYARLAESGVYSLLAEADSSTIKTDIQSWWGDLYRQLYADHETAYTSDTLVTALEELEDMFRQREHLAVMEMPIHQLKRMKVLEIGPGGGGHSALFKYRGADITAVDITPERALGTDIKLQLVPGSGGRAFQADAENLPFKDNSFDIVYSNGVLHHSEDTDKCLAEVHRVLKPGGQAVIMLYARHSATFWLNILPRAILTGEIFRWPEAQWIGRITEGTPKFGDTVNPVTRVYSSSEIENVFAAFDLRALRKSSFQFDNFALPKLTQLRRGLLKLLGRQPHEGGELVYGQPFFVETRLENFLGRFIGFAWNIRAFK